MLPSLPKVVPAYLTAQKSEFEVREIGYRLSVVGRRAFPERDVKNTCYCYCYCYRGTVFRLRLQHTLGNCHIEPLYIANTIRAVAPIRHTLCISLPSIPFPPFQSNPLSPLAFPFLFFVQARPSSNCIGYQSLPVLSHWLWPNYNDRQWTHTIEC